MDELDARLLDHLEGAKALPPGDFEQIRATLACSEKPPDVRQLLLSFRQLSAEELIDALLVTRGADDWVVPGYRITEELGHGAMGTVYRAVQQSDGREVALKLLSDKFLADKSAVERFERELALARKLQHRGLPWYGERGRCRGGNHYYAMQLVQGENLRQRMQRLNGPIEQEVAWKVLYQMSMVLQHMSEHKIVHRDIKPDNILIDDELIWLIDLGLAIQPSDDGMQLTDENLVMGTPYYMSPEQARGNRMLTVASDIYSLGATMYHAVTRKPPFDGSSALEVMTHHDKTPVEPPHHVRPNLKLPLSELIVSMLAKHPLQRPRPDKLCEQINRSLQKLHRIDLPQEEPQVFEPLPIDAPPDDPALPARPSRAGRSSPGRLAQSEELVQVKRAIEKSGATRKVGGPTLAHWLSFAGITLGVALLAFLLAGGPSASSSGEDDNKQPRASDPPPKKQQQQQPKKQPPKQQQQQPKKQPPRWPPSYLERSAGRVPRIQVLLARLPDSGLRYPALAPGGARLLAHDDARRGRSASLPDGLQLEPGGGVALPLRIDGLRGLAARFDRRSPKLDDIPGLALMAGSLLVEIGRVDGARRFHRIAILRQGQLTTLARSALDEAYLDASDSQHELTLRLESGQLTLRVVAGSQTQTLSAAIQPEAGPLVILFSGKSGRITLRELSVEAGKLSAP